MNSLSRLGADYLGRGRCAFRVWAPLTIAGTSQLRLSPKSLALFQRVQTID